MNGKDSRPGCGHCAACCGLCTGGISIFSGLTLEEHRSLVRIARHVDVAKGQTLFHAGDKTGRIIAMRFGQLKLRRISPDGQELIMGFLSAGETMGEDSLYADTVYDADLVATEDSGTCLISADAITSLVLVNPQLGAALLRSLGQKLHDARYMTEILSKKQATSRIAGFLLRDLNRQPGGEFRLSQEDLGNQVCLRRETVSRSLKTLEQLGCIRLTGYRSIQVLKQDCLQDIFLDDVVL
ncbi:MAG: Crp/Fnr family transcriptional regulator [Clostridiales bacterium]|nr:Crp/Fnr family transcriptional regulator [Clostridiales bacterium]